MFLSLIVGGAFGALLGYFGSCSSGACPLTANWQRGAFFGAMLGLVFHLASGRNGARALVSENIQPVDAQNFDAEVLKSDRPVVVDFYATWCGPCKRLMPMLDELAAGFGDSVKFVKVDIDRSPELARRYQVEGVPTLVFLQHGKETGRSVGLPRKESLLAQLQAVSSHSRSSSPGS